MRRIKSVNENGIWSWELQAKQYPTFGNGIVYFKGMLKDNKWVDCLLFYGVDGTLQGVLNHYPFTYFPYQKNGSINLVVRKDKRRQGIATALLDEARKRFKINLKRQNYTPLGKKFIENYRLQLHKSVLQDVM